MFYIVCSPIYFSIQKKMLKRSENFAVDIKKQSLLDNDLLFDMEINKLYDINNKVFKT